MVLIGWPLRLTTTVFPTASQALHIHFMAKEEEEE